MVGRTASVISPFYSLLPGWATQDADLGIHDKIILPFGLFIVPIFPNIFSLISSSKAVFNQDKKTSEGHYFISKYNPNPILYKGTEFFTKSYFLISLSLQLDVVDI